MVLTAFDKDGNGVVDLNEFMSAIKVSPLGFQTANHSIGHQIFKFFPTLTILKRFLSQFDFLNRANCQLPASK